MVKIQFFWALFALSPLALAEPVIPPKPESTISHAVDYLTREIGSRQVIKQGKRIQPDKASRNIYSPEQMAAVRAVFGSDDPLAVKRLPAAGGRSNYSLTLPAGQFQDDQEQLKWEEFSMQLGVAPDGSRTMTGSLPSSSISDKEARFDLQAIRTSDAMQADYWSGKSSGEIGQIRFKPARVDDQGFTVDDIRFANEIKRQGRYYGGLEEMTLGSFSVFGHSIDKMHLALRMRKLDASTMASLKLEMDRARTDGGNEADSVKPLARYAPLLKRLAMLGAALDIEDISGSYKGIKVVIKGRLSMPNATDADFESSAAIAGKLAGKLEIAVPLQLLREVAGEMALNASSKENLNVPVDTLSAQMFESMVGKLVANHFARLDKDMLRATIELKSGVLAVNGTTMPLEPLLALFEEKKLPPADTEPPVALYMRDRGLEASQLFALNGDLYGMLDMCERTAYGIGVEIDPEQANTWCTKAWKKSQYRASAPLGSLYLEGQVDDAAIPTLLQEAAEKFKFDEAQYLMYRIYSEGKGVPVDRQKAAAYLRLAADQGNEDAVKAMKESDAGYEPPARASSSEKNDPWSFPASLDGGFVNTKNFRFDKDKYRRLTVSMDNLQKDETWAPLLAVCVSAINPSDVACFNLQGLRSDTPQIEVNSNSRGTTSRERTNAKRLQALFKPGDKFDLVVYARGKQVHFVVNGDDALVQDVNFPVEVLSLNCSTADCKFDFRRPE